MENNRHFPSLEFLVIFIMLFTLGPVLAETGYQDSGQFNINTVQLTGVYLCRLKSGEFLASRRMTLIK